VLREIDADIVGLQEVEAGSFPGAGVRQLEFIGAEIGLEAIAGPTLTNLHGPYGNGLLTRHPIREVRHVDLSVSRREPRRALDVTLEIAGRKLRVINTHFGLRRAEQLEQADRLLRIIEDHHGPLVLLGDFNEWMPTRGPLRRLRDRFGTAPRLRTCPAWRPMLPLDRIWVEPREALLDLAVHRSPASRRASDHLPIRATLSFRHEARARKKGEAEASPLLHGS
jgi:endonuclease/exonuclease/phosphatase family metal-dependent hydrolase